MIVCERVVDITPQQRRTIAQIQDTLRRVVRGLRTTFPNEAMWSVVEREWQGHVFVGTRLHRAEYEPQTGCLRIGVDTNGSQDAIPLLFTRCLLEMIRSSTGFKKCTDHMRVALDHAKEMGVKVGLMCDDIKDYGLIQTPYYDENQCDSQGQDGRQWTFPELIGRDIDDAVAMLRAGYPHLHIRSMAWDTMHTQGSWSSPESTVVIVYDPWSRKVVFPEPHLQSMAPQDGLTQNCFFVSDEGICIGAPRRVPDEWKALIGKSLGDATNSLRWTYPHAVVETQPINAPIDRGTRRRDRIRVLFDPQTGETRRVILG